MHAFFATTTFLTSRQDHLVMFDRDNTLIEDRGYVHKTQDLRWMPEVIECIRYLSEDSTIMICSNQSGISRGYFSIHDSINLFMEMNLSLEKLGLRKLDGYVFCPHLPSQGCDCRKPQPAMLNFCLRMSGNSNEDAIFVGDSQSDLKAAYSARIPFLQAGAGLYERIRRHFEC